jgi:hypothetical protein
MASTEEDDISETADNLLAYGVSCFMSLFTDDQTIISGHRKHERTFNATVETVDGKSYRIFLFDGIAASIFSALRSILSGDDICVLDTFSALATKIFDDADKADILLRAVLSNALIFVLFHEYAHIACGHFRFAMARQGGGLAQPCCFQEIGDDPYRFALSASLGREINGNFLALSELEADGTAYEVLVEFAYEILIANSEIAENLASIAPPNDVPRATREAANELLFYSVCLTLSLLEFARKGQEGAANGYPLPFSRVLNVATIMLRKLAPSLEEEKDGRVRLSDSALPWVREFGVRTIYNAMEFCEAACHGLGLDLKDVIKFDRIDESAAKILTSDLIELVKDKQRELLTAEAQELQKLQGLGNEFRLVLQPFRVKKWWN